MAITREQLQAKASSIARVRVEGKNLKKALKGRFSKTETIESGGILGNGLIAIDGTYYESSFDGETGTAVPVVNIGRPSAAIYAPASSQAGLVSRSSSTSGTGTGGTGGLPIHSLTDHIGLLADYQAPQFLMVNGTRALTGNLAVDAGVTIDGVDLSAHVIDVNAHHNKVHTITDMAHHQVTGSQYSVIGLSATNVLGVLETTNRGDLTANAILRSGASNDLYINTMYAQTKLRTPLIDSAASLTLSPVDNVVVTRPLFVNNTLTATGDLYIDPVGLVQFPNGQTLRGGEFVGNVIPAIAGWQINEIAEQPGNHVLTIHEIQADELAVKVFVADETRVDRGTQYWAKSFGILAEPFTTPGSIGATVPIRFENSPALEGAIATDGDWFMFQLIDRGVGLIIASIWGQVSGYIDDTEDLVFPDTQRWTFTLRTAHYAKDLRKGRIGIDFGASGQSSIQLSTVDSSGSPYILMRKWEGANPYSSLYHKTLLKIGNLNSGVGYLPAYIDDPVGYGLFVRPDSSADKFIIVDVDGIRLFGVDLKIYDGSNQTVDLSSVDGSMKLGTDISADVTTSFDFDGTTGDLRITGDLYTDKAHLLRASGLNLEQDVWGSWDDRRAIQWWADLSSMTGDPTLTILTGKMPTGFAINQNFNYITANPTGGVLAQIEITASGQGSSYSAYLFLQGGSDTLPTTSAAEIRAENISLWGETEIDGSLDVSGTLAVTSTFSAAGGTLTGSLSSRQVAPSADNTYKSGLVGSRWSELHVVNLYADVIVGTPSYAHSHVASEIVSGVFAAALIPTTLSTLTLTGSLTMDADSTSTSNGIRWLTDISANKHWYALARAHDYVTGADQNDFKMYFYDGSTFQTAYEIDSITRVVNFGQTPTAGGVLVSLSTHHHDAAYVPLARTVTAGSGLSGGGALSADITISHADTSSQANVTNTGGTVFQSATFDTYGHVQTITSLDLNTLYVPLARTVTAGAGLSGGGALSANITITMVAPATITVSSVNSAAAHTHAISSSSAPGAAASILASDASGFLTLPQLIATTKVRTPLIDTASGSLTISPSTAITTFSGGRPVTIDANAGNITKKGQSGGWVFGFHALGSADTDLGGFGFYGTTDALVRYYIGPSYTAPYITATSSGAGFGGQLTPAYAVDATGTARATVSVLTPLIATLSNADLTLAPHGTGKIKFNTGTTLTSISPNYANTIPYITGWQINETSSGSGRSSLTISKMRADELTVRVFVADEVRVDRGDELWTRSYGIVDVEFTLPSAISGTVTIIFEDSPAVSGAIFRVDDWIHIRRLDMATGLNLFNAWGQVTSYTDLPDGKQSWLFTLRDGATNEIVPKGALAISYGSTGDALIHLSAIDPDGAPYIRMSRWAGANPYNPANYTIYTQIGSLVGTPGYSAPDYGLFVRSGASANQYILANGAGLTMRGGNFIQYNAAESLQTVLISSVDGTMKLGTNIAAVGTTGFFFDGSTGNLTIGQVATNKANLIFDQTAGSLSIRNNTTAVITLDGAGNSSFTGEMTIGTSGGIWQGTGSFATPTTGIKLWNDSGFGRIAGYSSGTVQWYAGTDGKLYAGAGDVSIDASGIKIRATTAYAFRNSLSFVDSLNREEARLWSTSNTSVVALNLQATPTNLSTANRDANIVIQTNPAGTGVGTITLNADSIVIAGAMSTDGIAVTGTLAVTGNITVTGTVDGVDVLALYTAYTAHNHNAIYYTETESDARFVQLSGSTLTGTLTSRTVAPSANNTYDLGTSSNYYNDAYIRNLHIDVIVGTPSYSHSHAASDISSGTLDPARIPVMTSAFVIDADTSGTSNYIRFLTQTSTGKAWDLVARAHDYATGAQQNDLLLTYYDGSTIYVAMQFDSATRVIDFGQTPTVGGTSVSLTTHNHDAAYVPLARTVTAGAGMTGGGALSANITISHADTSSQANVTNTGGTVFQSATFDTYGHIQTITSLDLNTLYVPLARTVTAGAGLTGGGALSSNITVSHADTSSQGSVDNSGVNFIQDITVDTYGHVTAIGTASISSALDSIYVNVTGDTMSGNLILPTAWTLDTQAITRGYTLSRGMNLITNGSGLLATNYNLSGFTFDAIETHGGGGSFRHTGASATKFNDEYIPVDPEKYYRLAVWGKSGDTDGSGYDAANRQYVGIACYDADKLSVSPYFYMRYGSSALTTLATQLNPGDTTVTLTNATGWGGAAANAWERQFLWYPYVNSLGYAYADYTYSRNATYTLGSYQTNGAWASGGITGNVITLTAPWVGPTLAAGTKVMNSTSGGSYKYTAISNSAVPNTWTRYEGTIGSIDTALTNSAYVFAPGTAYVRLLFLVNLAGSSSNIIRYSDIWFSELSSRNLEVASSTVPGVVALADQQLGTGVKWFPSRLGVGMSSAPTTYMLDVNGTGRFIGDLDVDGELLMTNGSFTTPTISNQTDTNTGIYWSAADALSFTTGGVLRGTFTSSGLDIVNGLSIAAGSAFTKTVTIGTTSTTNAGVLIAGRLGAEGVALLELSINIIPSSSIKTNQYGLKLTQISSNSFGGTDLTNYYSVYVDGPTRNGTASDHATNHWGLYIASSTYAVNNYAAYFGGAVGIGNTIPSYTLDVTGTARFTTSVTTSAITTVSGALTIGANTDVIFTPTSALVKITTGVSFQSDNFASQTTGLRLTHNGQIDARYLFVDEMHAKSFIADLEQALAGSQIIAKSVAVLYANFTAPAAGAATTLTVRDLPSAAGVAVFQNGDMIRIRKFTRTTSLTIADCWGTVVLDTSYGTSGFNSATKSQRFTFTRSSAPYAGTMTAATVTEADAIIIDYGVSGNGIYEVNAADGVAGANSPYVQIATWTTHPSAMDLRLRMGNLNGIGITDYGLVMGTGIGSSSTRTFDFRASTGSLTLGIVASNRGNLHWDGAASTLSLRVNTTEVITFDSSGNSSFTGVMKIGTSGGIYQGSGTFASPTTGLKIWNSGTYGQIAGYNAGTVQWYAGTDGKLYAGAGSVTIDEHGIRAFNGANQTINISAGGTSFWFGTSASDQRFIWDFSTLETNNLDITMSHAGTEAIRFDRLSGIELLLDNSKRILWTTGIGSGTSNADIQVFQGSGSTIFSQQVDGTVGNPGGVMQFDAAAYSNASNARLTLSGASSGGSSIVLDADLFLLFGNAALAGTYAGSGTSGFQVAFAVSETARGADNVRIGINGTPRIIFEHNGYNQWVIDNSAGIFRWFQPGVEYMTLSTSILTTNTDISLSHFDNNAGIGRMVAVGRNNDGSTPASGTLRITNRSGTDYYTWVDASANFRISTGTPTSASDTGGTVVGTQTSSLDSKKVIGEFVDYDHALATIISTPLYDFTYKSNSFNGEKFTGIITDYSPTFGMDRDAAHPHGKSLNEINAHGYAMAAIKSLYAKHLEVKSEIEILKLRIAALEKKL